MQYMYQGFTAWLRAHEFIAVWLEGIALVAILALDWMERRERRQEQHQQHEETAANLAVSQRQVEAATEAALAAKRSAEISASLHRPFMGLSNVTLPLGGATRLWNIHFSLKNYGTLPALRVSLKANFFTDGAPRAYKTEQASVQVFPSDQLDSVIQFDLGDADLPLIRGGNKKLTIKTCISYEAEDSRCFEYTAEASYANGKFGIDKSETLLAPQRAVTTGGHKPMSPA